MDTALQSRPAEASIEDRIPRLRETPMTEGDVAASHLVHDRFSEITLVCKLHNAGQEIYSAFAPVAGQEDVLLAFATKVENEVRSHPAAQREGQLFTVSFRPIDAAAAYREAGAGVTRLLVFPLESTTSPRGNLSPLAVRNFCGDWAETQHEALSVMIHPSDITDNIDRDEQNRLLSEAQINRLDVLQSRMLFEAMAASMQSLEAQTGLIGQLKNIRTQIALYRQAGNTGKTLLEISRTLRGESRELMQTLARGAVEAAALPGTAHLAGMMKNFRQELRATGVLAEKAPPKIVAAPRADKAAPQASAPLSVVSESKSVVSATVATPSPVTTVSTNTDIKHDPKPALAVASVEPAKSLSPKVATAPAAMVAAAAPAETKIAPLILTKNDAELPAQTTTDKPAPILSDVWAAKDGDTLQKQRLEPAPIEKDEAKNRTLLWNFNSPKETKIFKAPTTHLSSNALLTAKEPKQPKGIIRKFRAAAAGACANCKGGNCAACSRGSFSPDKLAAARKMLKQKYG